ncbi:hypothetical protein D1007_01335 [Hordeum vulgare]|nr:hypothetical protein D1007_01335 [Hordeum vulgare]
MSSPRRRRRGRSSTAPLENEDLLPEILLRLPPLPCSLPRAFLVCERWRGIVSCARFLRRFREHRRRSPPLLGCFVEGISPVRFEPTLEGPNRVPQSRFPFPIAALHTYVILGCRHGLMLIFLWRRNQLLVVASVYSSETGAWSNLVSAPLPAAADPDVLTAVYHDTCSVMVGNSLYWLLVGHLFGILEFNLDTQSLSVIHAPVDVDVNTCSATVMRADGGGLGFLFLSGYCVKLWERKTDSDGVASWVLGRTVALDKLLSMNSEEGSQSPRILMFAEENKCGVTVDIYRRLQSPV